MNFKEFRRLAEDDNVEVGQAEDFHEPTGTFSSSLSNPRTLSQLNYFLVNHLKDSFNKYVLRPKAEKMLVNLGYGVKSKKMLDDYEKECEDYSYEYELEQKNEVLIETLRQQGISDNVINNIIDAMLLKLNLDDENGIEGEALAKALVDDEGSK